ncbi:MAG: hypothetical protein WCT37_02095 [Patescibacteria group bacterium]|jgi:hypothetical protein
MLSFEKTPVAEKSENSEENGMTRRKFLSYLGAGAAGTAAELFGFKIFKKTGEIDWDFFSEINIKKERGPNKQLITVGIEIANRVEQIIKRGNKIEEELQSADSEEKNKLEQEKKSLNRAFDGLPTQRVGDISRANLQEANEFAEKIIADEKVLDNFSFFKLFIKDYLGDGVCNLVYEHNNAAAYLEIGKMDREELKTRLTRLKEFLDSQKTKYILQEDILYCLLDPNFNPELDHKRVAKLLDSKSPEWKEYPANLLLNKNGVNDEEYYFTRYKTNNHLEAFDIIELNKIAGLLLKIKNPSFIKSVFANRDKDYEAYGEFGGAIAIPKKITELIDIPAEETVSDSSYVVPAKRTAIEPASLAVYHFHAQKIKDNTLGPSVGDSGSPIPQLVFSSFDKDKIAVHFYVSRRNSKFTLSGPKFQEMSVICLGVLER